MSMHGYLRRVVARAAAMVARKNGRRQAGSLCYVCQGLEGRVLLSGTQYIVNSLLDVVAADGVVTLREAIQAANTNVAVNEAAAGSATETDGIGFDPALFASGLAKIKLGGTELQIADDLKLHGPGADLLRIDANASSRVLSIGSGADVTIDGITLANGRQSNIAGGIFNTGTLELRDVVVSDNYSRGSAGGIYNSGSLTIIDGAISRNSSFNSGGAIGLAVGSALDVSGTVFSDNKTLLIGPNALGVVIYMPGGTATITDATFLGDPANRWSGIHVAGGTMTLSGHIVLNDASVLNYGGLNLTDFTVTGNAGGGVGNNAGGQLTVTRGTLDGVGIFNGGSISMEDTTVSGVSRAYGGAVNNTGTATLKNVTICRNSASGGDSGIYNSGTVSATNLAVFGNVNASTAAGGAVGNYGTMTLANSTISGNSSYNGGGIFNSMASVLTLINVTVSGNSATQSGGGIYSHSGVKLINTIVAGNQALYGPDLSGSISSGSDYNLIGVLDGTQVAAAGPHTRYGTASSRLDPKLGELTEINGFAVKPLLDGSLAIDGGSDALATDSWGEPLVEDAAGDARMVGSAIDIGAVEGASAPRAGHNYVVESLEDKVSADGILTFREAFEAANLNHPVGDAPAGSFTEADRIAFAPGVAGRIETGTWLAIYGSMEIQGLGAGQTEFHGDGTNRTLQVVGSSSAVITGVSITGGAGGVYNGGTLALSDSIVSNNTASSTIPIGAGGGGIFNAGSLVIARSAIVHNTASLGGEGGGLCNIGSATLTNVLVAENKVTGSGTNATGGGVENYAGTLTMINVTVTGNSASTKGGGVRNGGTLILANAIIAGNSAPADAELSGVSSGGSDYNFISVLDAAQAVTAGAHTIYGSVTAPLDAMLGEVVTIDGMPVAPLLSGSPAINAGSNALAADGDGVPLTTDGAGQARIAGGVVDIGAYEYQAQGLAIAGSAGDDAIGVGGDASFITWTVNGKALSMPRTLVTGIRIDAGVGSDALPFNFDLADMNLIVQASESTRAAMLAAVSEAIRAGRNTSPLWTGTGIRSSAAAGNVLTGLAVIVNERVADGEAVAMYQTFGGVGVDRNSILVKWTWNGDVDLNGKVDADDYFMVDSGFLSGGVLKGYRNGDVDFSGGIDADDYFLVDSAFLGQGGVMAARAAEGFTTKPRWHEGQLVNRRRVGRKAGKKPQTDTVIQMNTDEEEEVGRGEDGEMG